MNPSPASEIRSPLKRAGKLAKWGLYGVILIVISLSAYLFLRTEDPKPEVPTDKANTVRVKREKEPPAPREVAPWESKASPPLPRKASKSRGAMGAKAGSLATAQKLLEKLMEIEFDGNAITPEQAKELNRLLALLESQGTAALPALREFLEVGDDINFDALKGGDQVDYASLRIALLDMVLQIGGQEAVEISLDTLKLSSDPLEIALLGRALEEMAPEKYRTEALAAVRNGLSMAYGTRLGGRDITPLFEFWQKYGDASIVPDLENAAARWNYYATMTLAGLPGGAGVPSLIQLSKDPKILAMGNGDYALRMLAQVSLQYPEAGAALLEQAKSGLIPENAWRSISSALEGYSLQYGSPIFGTPSASNWSNAQINQRIAFIDQMLAVTTSPTALQSLRSSRNLLMAKLTHM